MFYTCCHTYNGVTGRDRGVRRESKATRAVLQGHRPFMSQVDPFRGSPQPGGHMKAAFGAR